MAPPPRLPPVLLDELVEEVLLRVPPDDPERLLRAALVCKCWCRIISDPGFRRRFREFHRTPPMLGFFSDLSTPFISTSSFLSPRAARHNCQAIDARHGRVLRHSVPWHLGDKPLDNAFRVLDPITGERRKLPLLPLPFYPCNWNAAVLCASLGTCDHLDCRRGPFLVVLVGTDHWGRMFSYVYSSQTAAWSECAAPRRLLCIDAKCSLRECALLPASV
ncbi:hypothetical protein U9M48_032170 [Paspalum notatum var. saurae]|uniref:F-box domain-containing protein n=1 Tax=Paspalum notatum var. saurae TaxID=547442 RepID=A0AAQ3U791_PASNO